MTETITTNIWFDGAPVCEAGSDEEFHAWLDGAPVIDNLAGSGTVTTSRRRIAFIF